jgi:hypothetical protein
VPAATEIAYHQKYGRKADKLGSQEPRKGGNDPRLGTFGEAPAFSGSTRLNPCEKAGELGRNQESNELGRNEIADEAGLSKQEGRKGGGGRK